MGRCWWAIVAGWDLLLHGKQFMSKRRSFREWPQNMWRINRIRHREDHAVIAT
jgi:hypothetical protein